MVKLYKDYHEAQKNFNQRVALFLKPLGEVNVYFLMHEEQYIEEIIENSPIPVREYMRSYRHIEGERYIRVTVEARNG